MRMKRRQIGKTFQRKDPTSMFMHWIGLKDEGKIKQGCKIFSLREQKELINISGEKWLSVLDKRSIGLVIEANF